MANYDGGHYFLTLFVPIKKGKAQKHDGSDCSHVVAIKQELEALPTAKQDRASVASPLNSPFARVQGIHFVRLFVVDDVSYNGRRPKNAISVFLKKINLTIPQKIDQLPHSYLVMTVDMDAEDGSDATLKETTDRLWNEAKVELKAVFDHCMGFEAVSDAASWFAYVKRCQVTTTMPFSDYWVEAVLRPDAVLPIYKIAGVIALISTALYIYDLHFFGLMSWVTVTLLAIAAIVLLFVIRAGTKPFPAAPNSDLPSILKALYVQKMFSDFVFQNQGADPAKLLAEFEKFVSLHRPEDKSYPSQQAGTLFAHQVEE